MQDKLRMINMLELNDENFKKEVLESKQLVLVDFWRLGCNACLLMIPIIEDMAKELNNRIKIGKLDINENPETAKMYKIPGVPTFIIFKDGKPIEKAVGLRSKEVLTDKLNSLS